MNASYAVIENGMVVNVIVWDGEDEFTVPDMPACRTCAYKPLYH